MDGSRNRGVARVAAGNIPPAVLEWVERTAPGSQVTSCTVRPLAGGNVARWVERLTLHLAGGRDPLELVRKDAPALEIAGLSAAQAARADGSAIPELVAHGSDWLILPFAPGMPLDWGDPVPVNLFDTLAVLHARYHGGAGLPGAIPRVTPDWWRALCLDWVDPRLGAHAGRHSAAAIARARALIGRAATLPAVTAILASLPPTLLHGDVHPGNVLVEPVLADPVLADRVLADPVLADSGRATLIDWGGSRVGPAALDLANLVTADSADVARYAATWRERTGQPLPAEAVELGYRWAALQIPVQYLPWMAGHRPTPAVEAALDQIEQAMDRLSG